MRQRRDGGNKNKGQEETGAGNALEEGKERRIEGIKSGMIGQKKRSDLVQIKSNQLRSWTTLRFDDKEMGAEIPSRFAFGGPHCSHLSSELNATFKQKETDNNKKLFPHVQNEMTEKRGNRRGPQRFPPHFSLSSLLLFELPPALALSAPAEISTDPTGHLRKSSQDEHPSLRWSGVVKDPAPVPTPRSWKVANGNAE